MKIPGWSSTGRGGSCKETLFPRRPGDRQALVLPGRRRARMSRQAGRGGAFLRGYEKVVTCFRTRVALRAPKRVRPIEPGETDA